MEEGGGGTICDLQLTVGIEEWLVSFFVIFVEKKTVTKEVII